MGLSTLVLDANVLNNPDFLRWLRAYRGRKVLPVVAYVEVGVHFGAQGRLARLRWLLEGAGIEIEWMRPDEADQASESAVKVGDLAQNA